MAVMTGALIDYPVAEDAPDYKGIIIIEWPVSGPKPTAVPPRIPAQRVLPGHLTTVRDEQDGEIIPCAGVTLHARTSTLITADVAVYLDKSGEIIRDPSVIWRESDGIPATYTFLVAEMRIGRTI